MRGRRGVGNGWRYSACMFCQEHLHSVTNGSDPGTSRWWVDVSQEDTLVQLTEGLQYPRS